MMIPLLTVAASPDAADAFTGSTSTLVFLLFTYVAGQFTNLGKLLGKSNFYVMKSVH